MLLSQSPRALRSDFSNAPLPGDRVRLTLDLRVRSVGGEIAEFNQDFIHLGGWLEVDTMSPEGRNPDAASHSFRSFALAVDGNMLENSVNHAWANEIVMELSSEPMLPGELEAIRRQDFRKTPHVDHHSPVWACTCRCVLPFPLMRPAGDASQHAKLQQRVIRSATIRRPAVLAGPAFNPARYGKATLLQSGAAGEREQHGMQRLQELIGIGDFVKERRQLAQAARLVSKGIKASRCFFGLLINLACSIAAARPGAASCWFAALKALLRNPPCRSA